MKNSVIFQKRTLLYTYLFTIATIFFFFLYGTASAYFTTGQDEIRLDKKTGLFLIDFSFGMNDHEVSIPISAERDGKTKSNALSYSVVNKEGLPVRGQATAAILSKASIPSGSEYYVTPKGFKRAFRLAVLFTPEKLGTDSYRVVVNHLPFKFDGSKELKLNESELDYYKTDLLSLGN